MLVPSLSKICHILFPAIITKVHSSYTCIIMFQDQNLFPMFNLSAYSLFHSCGFFFSSCKCKCHVTSYCLCPIPLPLISFIPTVVVVVVFCRVVSPHFSLYSCIQELHLFCSFVKILPQPHFQVWRGVSWCSLLKPGNPWKKTDDWSNWKLKSLNSGYLSTAHVIQTASVHVNIIVYYILSL